ncbi:MAG: 3-hydroxyacyl-CoA dehydrogenase/enoyl-CoA hydratase family protein [Deltaproteobacteria bacterium]|nr:3-hydroxyacyl-CoA dehydrogenase/enoyl-CoA hydratase family protein [Deltaproteobacteria bacterium]
MKVGVIGSGSIGPDLAYGFVSALSRDPASRVFLVDIKQEALDQGVARIQSYIQKGVARGKLSAKGAKAVEDALVPTLKLSDLADCEYVLEAASEDLSIKRRILAQLEGVVRPDCLIGFATSGLPRAQISVEAKHPERCFVNHPFFPAWRSLPIEVVGSGDPELERRMIRTLKALGKVPIATADVACFAADDIFCNYISEAARIVEEGRATPAQVDKIVNDAIGGGGPFNVMDATRGNLLTVHCQELMRTAPTGSDWFTAPRSLTEKGNSPWHDRKSPSDGAYSAELGKEVLDRILAVLIGRAYFVLDRGICEATELNWLTRMALGFKKGLLELAEDLGADRATELCVRYAATRPGFEIPKSIAGTRLAAFDVNLKVEVVNGIGVVRVFRPEVKNALSKKTIAEIANAMDTLAAEPTVKGIIFTSYDGSLAGADIMELAALPDSAACEQICLDAHPIMERISRIEKPVVAALNGPVMGGGAELSMACHARVVGPELVLSQPEVNLAIIPGYGGTQRLPRLVGFDAAFEMLRTGRSMDAKEACARGWAYGAPDVEPEKGARELIKAVLLGDAKIGPVNEAPMAVPEKLPKVDIGHRSLAIDAILVDVIRRGLRMPLSEGLALEAKGFGRCRATVDMDIGMKNFIQNGPRVPAAFLHE